MCVVGAGAAEKQCQQQSKQERPSALKRCARCALTRGGPGGDGEGRGGGGDGERGLGGGGGEGRGGGERGGERSLGGGGECGEGGEGEGEGTGAGVALQVTADGQSQILEASLKRVPGGHFLKAATPPAHS